MQKEEENPQDTAVLVCSSLVQEFSYLTMVKLRLKLTLVFSAGISLAFSFPQFRQQ